MTQSAARRELDHVLHDVDGLLTEADKDLIARIVAHVVQQHARAAAGLTVEASLQVALASLDQIEVAGERIGRRVAWDVADRLISNATRSMRNALLG